MQGEWPVQDPVSGGVTGIKTLTALAALAIAWGAAAEPGGVTLRYFGHAFFFVASVEGVRLAMDPFRDIGYAMPGVEADIVTISHEAYDHSNAALIRGQPVVLRGLEPGGRGWSRVQHSWRDVRITALPGYHDKVQGKERGLNAIFLVEAGGVRIAHLSDIGDMPPEESVQALGRVDVLLVPVGGLHGLDAADATKVVERLKPAIAIPIHYKTGATAWSAMADERPFVEGKPRVKRMGNTLRLNRAGLPVETEIWVMDYR
jgi:L-ascorbate metabolism protein UlaG (beta-lactamase superfamily)